MLLACLLVAYLLEDKMEERRSSDSSDSVQDWWSARHCLMIGRRASLRRKHHKQSSLELVDQNDTCLFMVVWDFVWLSPTILSIRL